MAEVNPMNFTPKGDFESNGYSAYIIDLDTAERLGLMGMPLELNYEPNSEWATIKPFGKNNPNYHYKGSEDELEFDITWWATTDNRQDVIRKCKWLESATKADGDNGRPHLFRFLFGDLFSKATWIIKSAPYKLSHFNPEYGMMPEVATQKITLARFNRKNSNIAQIVDWRY